MERPLGIIHCLIISLISEARAAFKEVRAWS